MADDVYYLDDDMETGTPDKVIETIARRVGQYLRVNMDVKKGCIGRTSGNDGPIKAMESRHSPAFGDFNVMVALYATESLDNCKKVKTELLKRVSSGKLANEKGGAGGSSPDSPNCYYVFVALETPCVYYSENFQPDFAECKKMVKNVLKRGSVETIYIGKGSGENATSAMKARYDDRKKALGINEVIAIYEVSNQQESLRMETQLVDSFKGNTKVKNDTGGGGGRHASGANYKYYVYLALRVN